MTNFSGSSLFAGVNAGMANTYSMLSNMYSDGITQANLTNSLSNTNIIASQYGTTFASYLSKNFASVDKNSDGTLGAEEIQKLMNTMSTQGLTRDQINSLGGISGVSATAQATILDHFNEIDTNHDGRVSSGEVQGYILQSKMENRKIDDTQKMINRTSMFYGDDDASDTGSSLLSYKWMQEQTSNR